MRFVAFDPSTPGHSALRQKLVQRAMLDSELPLSHDEDLLGNLGEEEPLSILYVFQVQGFVRDTGGRNKLGKAALVFGLTDFVQLENKRLPTANEQVRKRLSELNKRRRAGRQSILLIESDGRSPAEVRMRSPDDDLAELERWGLASAFSVVLMECRGKAKGCRRVFKKVRKDQTSCGNPGCKVVVSRRFPSDRTNKRRREEYLRKHGAEPGILKEVLEERGRERHKR